MKKIFGCLTVAVACLFSLNQALAANSFKIVAVVNGDIISNQDIQNRINAFLMTTKIPLNDQTRNMIVQRVTHAAIDEKIKLQAAERNNIHISEKDIDASVANFEKNNRIPKGELKNILKQAKVSPDSFRSQMKSDLAWLRLLKNKMRGEGTITQKEIETALADAKKDLSTPKFQISEIFIKKEKAKDIQNLVDNLRNDNRFELYAMQFSDSPSASNGGNLGWINEGKLPAPLEKAAKKLSVGGISNAILLNDGYYILKLNQRFDPKKDKPVMPTEKEINTYLSNKKMETLAQKYLQDLRQKAVIELRN